MENEDPAQVQIGKLPQLNQSFLSLLKVALLVQEVKTDMSIMSSKYIVMLNSFSLISVDSDFRFDLDL